MTNRPRMMGCFSVLVATAGCAMTNEQDSAPLSVRVCHLSLSNDQTYLFVQSNDEPSACHVVSAVNFELVGVEVFDNACDEIGWVDSDRTQAPRTPRDDADAAVEGAIRPLAPHGLEYDVRIRTTVAGEARAQHAVGSVELIPWQGGCWARRTVSP
ncbi:MAG: hypothetical protein J0L92_20240 [Deltaproteobacteria bacterium]|nr:hypothetical protein [Deltaproteobacteria bacterium]